MYLKIQCVLLFTRLNLQLVEKKTDFGENLIRGGLGDGSFDFVKLSLLLVVIDDGSSGLKDGDGGGRAEVPFRRC